MLVRHLPPGSATERARRGEAGEWGYLEHLLADVRDLLRAANWQRSGDKKIPRPTPLPRPGDPERVARLSPAEVRARLLDLQARQRQVS